MLLQDIFGQLATGEFDQLSLAEDGQIDKEDYPKVIRHINLALTDLYSRFNIKQREVVVVLDPAKTSYPLHSDFAESNTDSTETKYIEDMTSPFTDDIIQIVEVFDDMGEGLPLNAMGHSQGVYTPEPTVVQVANGVNSNRLFIIYKASHPRLEPTLLDITGVKVELPPVFLHALLCFVGSRVNQNRLKEGSAAMAADLKQKYELECLRLEQLGLVNADTVGGKEEDAFEREGWV